MSLSLSFKISDRLDVEPKGWSVFIISLLNARDANVESTCSVWPIHRLAVNLNRQPYALIEGLFLSCRPPAIRLPVVGETLYAQATPVSVIVFSAVDGMPIGRTLAHIEDECLNGIHAISAVSPSVADVNASCPIILVGGILRIMTTSDHGVPCRVEVGAAVPVGGVNLKPKASAASLVASYKISTSGNACAAANAVAKPHYGPSSVLDSMGYGKSVEAAVSEVNKRVRRLGFLAKAPTTAFGAILERRCLGKIKRAAITRASPYSKISVAAYIEIYRQPSKLLSGQISKFRVSRGRNRNRILWTQIGHRGNLGRHGSCSNHGFCKARRRSHAVEPLILPNTPEKSSSRDPVHLQREAAA